MSRVAPPFPAFAAELAAPRSPLRSAIAGAFLQDEQAAVAALLAQVKTTPAEQSAAQELARRLIATLRAQRSRASGVDALMQEFSLSSHEGIALMCLAEALLRIPDRATADRLIADKLAGGDWRRHLGHSPSLFVNAASWGLLLTGTLVHDHADAQGLAHALTRLIARGGEPLIRKGMDAAMRLLAGQFVAGRTMDEALRRAQAREARGYRHSYDMLGEAALTAADTGTYYRAYESAIHAIGRASGGRGIHAGPGISVKLSALHPRYARAQRARVMAELLPRLQALLLLSSRYGIGLNVDAEEADRLELSLDLMEAVAFDPAIAGFDGIGFVVQAYQKRCPYVIDYLIDLARRTGRRFMIRLVKGAYWDGEIKRAQVDGLPGYPVYTRKAHTDLSYLVCAQRMLQAGDAVYPQFATHNALTMAAIHAKAQGLGVRDYEFQCLHGMGETLYDQVVGTDQLGVPCRIYAPVGAHETLLPYLVRRLLENGANSSFVNRLVDPAVPVERLLADPVEQARQSGGLPHPAIPLPALLFGNERVNSAGLDPGDEPALQTLANTMRAFGGPRWHATPLLARSPFGGAPRPIRNPADHTDLCGFVHEADAVGVAQACAAAAAAQSTWQGTSPSRRAAILRRAAALFETHRAELMALAMREAGKTLPNALGELREAVDFLRYYAAQADALPDGEPLGPVVCISPWNFPLSIFTGQVAAALAAGNTVLAKPAEQTPLIAFRAVQLLHDAGIPREALLFLPGRGETVGAQLVADRRTAGIVFTGSTDVARAINRTLAQRSVAERREIPLIAETGGQNAMIVDSSALCEQVVRDALVSAFDSAGQRCSALRVLCLQEEIAERTLAMLYGAFRELRVGRPDALATDVGPVIDEEAQRKLLAHIDHMRAAGYKVTQLALPDALADGTFVPPTIIEIDRIGALEHEVFGPVLHVMRYARAALPQLIDDINATGYGLTTGIHTRIDETIACVTARARVGNLYVNRTIIGAVVGAQPFGGEGWSGTGPKAGGPLYLRRLRQDFETSQLPLPTVEGAPSPALPVPPSFAALAQWSEDNDETFARWCRSYASNSSYGREIALPGPTGESNVLRFAPRGKVLCLTSDADTLRNQLAAVLATGNRPALLSAARPLLPAGMPAAVSDGIAWLDDLARCSGLAFALHDEAARDCLPALAQRDGAIVSTLCTRGEMPVPLWRLVTERAVCVNTAAAGGNAALMAMQA